jgi:hypothetical protein
VSFTSMNWCRMIYGHRSTGCEGRGAKSTKPEARCAAAEATLGAASTWATDTEPDGCVRVCSFRAPQAEAVDAIHQATAPKPWRVGFGE